MITKELPLHTSSTIGIPHALQNDRSWKFPDTHACLYSFFVAVVKHQTISILMNSLFQLIVQGDMVHRGREWVASHEVHMLARTWESWLHGVHSHETDTGECWCLAYSVLFIKSKTQIRILPVFIVGLCTLDDLFNLILCRHALMIVS